MAKYTNYPIADCMETASKLVRNGDAIILQKFTCSKCGSRQTIDTPSTFFTHGKCEECGGITDMQVTGCNYLTHQVGSEKGRRELMKLYSLSSIPTTLTFADCNQFMKDNPHVSEE